MDTGQATSNEGGTRASRVLSRRGFLRAGAATGLAAAMASTIGRIGVAAGPRSNEAATSGEGSNTMVKATNVVLVHGAWADASSWSRVIPLLQQSGLHVSAAQLSLTSLADDVAITRRVIDAIQGPVTLVGHSYGGAVISGAGNAPNVTSLVYVAAFAPDEGESLGDLIGRYPALPSGQHARPDSAGFLSIDPETFPQDFAADVDAEQAKVMAVVQRPINGAALGEKARAAAWHNLPSFYQVSENDAMIAPDLERFFADRMKATTISLKASHASMVSHPTDIAQLIIAAAQG